MKFEIEGKTCFCEEIIEKEDLLIIKNGFTGKKTMLLLRIEPVEEQLYHRVFQAIWLVIQQGRPIGVSVLTPAFLSPGIRQYVRYLELEESVAVQTQGEVTLGADYAEEIIVSPHFGGGVFFKNAQSFVNSTVRSICTELEKVSEGAQ